MSYIALYRKWRPLVFEDVVEQEHVVKTLKNSVNTGRIAHAYLFCGTRGTGKTTMAKIFSRAINCLSPVNGDPCNECEICKGVLSGNIMDVIEIDAASNNSVDNVREIRDEVIYAPSQAKYKVYIIDEVHMLSSGAFNALLKTLEEPPSHVIFILATTEPHKLPATILSRCQRFDFRRITVESITGRLDKIAGAGGIVLQQEAARLIARMSDGALRDAISILDQCISVGGKEISYSDVLKVVGVVNDTFMADMVEAVNSRNVDKVLALVETLVMEGKDITQFVSDLVLYYRNLLICKITGKPGEIIEASEEALEIMKKQGKDLVQQEIMDIIKELSLLESGLKWATHPRILLEVTLIKLCEQAISPAEDDITGRLAALEKKINNLDFTARPAPAAREKDGEARYETGRPAEKKETETKKAPAAESPAAAGGQALKPLESWEDIIKDLKNGGRMVLYTNLLDTRAVELDSRFVGIVFGSGSSSFSKMLVSKPENMEVVAEAVSKKLGREVRVKCLDEESLAGGRKEAQKEEKDDFVRKAQDLAQRLGVPADVIDE